MAHELQSRFEHGFGRQRVNIDNAGVDGGRRSDGGAFGDPKSRPRAVVMRDVRQGHVSADQAVQAYGMVTG